MLRSLTKTGHRLASGSLILKRNLASTSFLNIQATSPRLQEVCPAHAAPSAQKKADHVEPAFDKVAWDNAKPFKDIPGPKPLPILGNTWRFIPKIGDYAKHTSKGDITGLFRALYEDYGEIVKMEKVLGRKTGVTLFNPEDIEMVYKIEGIVPQRDILPSMSYFRQHYRQDLFQHAKGLLTSQGDEWYTFRNKVNSIMMQPKAVRQYVEPIDNIAQEFITRIKKIRGSDNRLTEDTLKELNKWSLESIACVALNTKLNCMADNLPKDSLGMQMIIMAEEIFTMGMKLDFEPSIWKMVSTPTFREGMALYNRQTTMGQKIIESVMKKMEEDKKAGIIANASGEPSVLEKLLKIDPKVAIVMALDMLLAGVDTTSTALVNVLYYLAANPAKQEKLHKEIFGLLPDKSTKLTVEALNSMLYLRACIKEAGRLYPVTPGTFRILTRDIVLRGYRIPKGTEMLFPHMLVSIFEHQFKRADEYLPERWLREEASSELSYKNAHPFCTMQFGFGSRSCIGRRFAELELEVALINIMRNFELTWEGAPPKKITTSINYLEGPFRFVYNDVKV